MSAKSVFQPEKAEFRLSRLGWAAFFFFLSLLVYSVFILARPVPFVYDEGTYALMISEFSSNPGMVLPTVTGVHVEWKPPLFTWVYSALSLPLARLPIPVESVFRLPSALFGAVDAALVFLIADRFYGRKTGIASALLFFTAPLALFSSTTVMMESFALMLSLSAIYLYADGKYWPGLLFLGMLALTKWLYVAFPIAFIIAVLWGRKELPRALASFIIVPIALAFYVLLAYFFGDPAAAAYHLAFDLFRPVPNFDPTTIMGNYFLFAVVTFPLSEIALLLALLTISNPPKEPELLALCIAGMALPLSGLFLFWYATPVLPFIIMFVAKRIEGMDKGALFAAVISGFFVLNMLYLASPLAPADYGARQMAIFMKGKNVTFIEPHEHFGAWDRVNGLYRGTGKSYLMLEQSNAGLLFYRFHDSQDYGNLRAVFSEYNESPGCGDYLVVHKKFGLLDGASYNWSVPGCYQPLWSVDHYDVYGAKGNATAG
jgi:4-amino-4-deoxy-L-arabinose transferase-like glycosyltransferase